MDEDFLEDRLRYNDLAPQDFLVGERELQEYDVLREEYYCLLIKLEAFAPVGRERAFAVTNLQQSLMWAKAAMGRGAR